MIFFQGFISSINSKWDNINFLIVFKKANCFISRSFAILNNVAISMHNVVTYQIGNLLDRMHIRFLVYSSE
jgi:hypothetical protein